ncbi:MAG: DUF4097 family beta strand repeat-containing protein [Elusimicrobiales bacterium]
MNKSVFILLAFACCAVSVRAEVTNVSREFPAKDVESMVISAVSGDVDFKPADGPVRIYVARFDSEKCSLETVVSSGQLTATLRPAERARKNGEDDCSAGMAVSAPAAVKLDISAVSGNVSANSARQEMKIGTVSGSITVISAGGPVGIATVSGPVSVRGAAQGLAVNTASGGIEAENVAGGAKLSTVSGNMRVSGLAGQLKAETVSGNVSGSLYGTADVNTDSGAINLHWPKAPPSGEISLSTINGDVGLFFPAGTKMDLSFLSRKGMRTGARFPSAGGKGLRVNITSMSGDLEMSAQ